MPTGTSARIIRGREPRNSTPAASPPLTAASMPNTTAISSSAAEDSAISAARHTRPSMTGLEAMLH